MTVLWSGSAAVAATGTGVVFSASFASKVRNPRAWQAYLAAIRSSRAFPAVLAHPAAAVLAGVEFVVVLLVGWPASRAVGLAIALVLAFGLTVGVGIAVARGSEASCACFGTGERLSGTHLARNVVLTVLVGSGWVTTQNGHGASPDWLDNVVGLLLGLVFAALIIGWEEISWALSGLRDGVRS